MRQIFAHIRTHVRWYVLGLLLLLSIFLLNAVIREDRHGVMTVAFLNIGQGDAIYIESPTGTQVVVDGGPDDALSRELSHVMPWYDKSLDMIAVTNPDKDHYEGFISLLKKMSVDVVLEPGTVSKTETYALLEKEIADNHIPKIVARRGEMVDLGGGAYLQILFPDRDVSGLASNDGSLVMRLVYGDTSVMLQGDSPQNIEHYLVGLDGPNLHSTILKAGHHGSRTSSSEEYVRAVAPEWAVMSSGISNSYGHPHQEALDTFSTLKIPALDTCTMGRIVFHSDGKKFTFDTKVKPVSAGCKG